VKKPRFPRLTSFALIAILLTLVIAWIAPQQLGVTLYKLSLVTLAAVLGYWIDRGVFPYARPHDILRSAYADEYQHDSVSARAYRLQAAYAALRRAIIIAAVILAIALGA